MGELPWIFLSFGRWSWASRWGDSKEPVHGPPRTGQSSYTTCSVPGITLCWMLGLRCRSRAEPENSSPVPWEWILGNWSLPQGSLQPLRPWDMHALSSLLCDVCHRVDHDLWLLLRRISSLRLSPQDFCTELSNVPPWSEPSSAVEAQGTGPFWNGLRQWGPGRQ